MAEPGRAVPEQASSIGRGCAVIAKRTAVYVFTGSVGVGWIFGTKRTGPKRLGFPEFSLCQFRRTALYAPAAGRLAAAMATIWARRRPIRDGAARSNLLNCRISQGSNRASRNHRSANKSARWKNGPARPACRDRSENSNASIVRSAPGGGFIAAIGPAAVEIFSAKIRRWRPDAPGSNRYAGLKPNVRSKRPA